MPRESREKRIREILMCTYLQSPITRRKLRGYLGISKSWLSELVKELLDRELISIKKQNKENVLHITEKGYKLLFRQQGYSETTIVKIIEHELKKTGINFEEANLHGIYFNFKIAYERKTILIRVIEGFMIPTAPEDLYELNRILDWIVSSRKKEVRRKTLKIELILSRLVDQKGLLLSIINFAEIVDSIIILIICGTDPRNWPENIAQKINQLGEKFQRPLLVDIRKRLINIMNHVPKNLHIIHSGDMPLEDIINKILKIIKNK